MITDIYIDDEDGEAMVGVECEPHCIGHEDHDWQSPEWLGGCAENPGVFGHGGGVKIKEVCRLCGKYRVTDTWAQNPRTGAQLDHDGVEYFPSDVESEDWVEAQGIEEEDEGVGA